MEMLCGVTGPGTETCACFPKNWSKTMHVVCQLVKSLNIVKVSSCPLSVGTGISKLGSQL